MAVLRIQYNFSIVLHIRLKTCRSNILLGKMCAPEKLCASESFWNRELGSRTSFVKDSNKIVHFFLTNWDSLHARSDSTQWLFTAITSHGFIGKKAQKDCSIQEFCLERANS